MADIVKLDLFQKIVNVSWPGGKRLIIATDAHFTGPGGENGQGFAITTINGITLPSNTLDISLSSALLTYGNNLDIEVSIFQSFFGFAGNMARTNIWHGPLSVTVNNANGSTFSTVSKNFSLSITTPPAVTIPATSFTVNSSGIVT